MSLAIRLSVVLKTVPVILNTFIVFIYDPLSIPIDHPCISIYPPCIPIDSPYIPMHPPYIPIDLPCS